MDLMVPLNCLRFGHEDGAGINARTTGRDDDIETLAANIEARGLIENLIVKRGPRAFDETIYFVSNGNRRLKALRLLHGEDAEMPIACSLREVDEDGAFEDSLATAVTTRPLHPVDQFEAFARLRDRAGKSVGDIAGQYGMSAREVEQALALGHLSANVRAAWRRGELRAEAARAFTLAADHARQDELLMELEAGSDDGLRGIDDGDVKRALKIGRDHGGALVAFVGIEEYVKAGGQVVRDLFGSDHQISDLTLAKMMAAEKLRGECARLKAEGWAFAVTRESLGSGQAYYNLGSVAAKSEPSDVEQEEIDRLEAIFNPDGQFGEYDGPQFSDLTPLQQAAYLRYRQLTHEIARRAYTPAMMAKSGCVLSVDENGHLEIELGRTRPEQKAAAAKVARAEQAGAPDRLGNAASSKAQAAPEPAELSQALRDRLEQQMLTATRAALARQAEQDDSEMLALLAKAFCAMITPERPFSMPDGVRTKLPSIRQALRAPIFNVEIAAAFEAEDYFSNAPKAFVIGAIKEAVNADEARKASALSKAELTKYALANVVPAGWLPKELRTVHYAPRAGTPAVAVKPGPPAGKRTAAAGKPVRAAPGKKVARPVKKAAAAKKRAAR